MVKINKYEEKYKKTISELVKKSFPELKKEYIYIKEKQVPYQAHVSYFPWGFRIIINRRLRKSSKNKIKRIIIHELCHLSIFKKWDIIKTNLDFIYYLLSKKHRLEVEREANILMIKKGYGKLVLEARRENLKRGLGYSLTEEQIKQLKNKK